METRNATAIPVNKMLHSNPVKENPNLMIFIALAPNITGIAKKNENSAATILEVPKKIAPKIVEPERDVPGIRDKTWNAPISNAVL